MDYTEVGKRILKSRNAKGLTQEELSELSGVSIPHISNIENGKTKIKVDTLVKLSNALNVSADYLLCGSVDAAQFIQEKEMADILEGCTPHEKNIIYQLMRSYVDILKKNSSQEQ